MLACECKTWYVTRRLNRREIEVEEETLRLVAVTTEGVRLSE